VTIVQAIVLGLVQGICEFVPISSSGHLIIVPWLFNWDFFLAHPELNKTFDVALHLGTFFAVVAYYWRDIGHILRDFFRSLVRRHIETSGERLAWLLLLSTIPAGVLGVAFEKVVEDQLGKPWLIAVLMIVFGAVIWVIDARAPQRKEVEDLRWKGALGIGFAQALALAPGVSRSGVTMMAGRLDEFTRSAAARYAFFLSVPVVGGGAAYKALELTKTGLPSGTVAPFLAGMTAAALSGFAAIWFTIAYLRRHSFKLFAIYRFVVGGGILLVIVLGLRHAGGI
jgi:undecaprenyl-diphosphatase